MNNKLIKNFSKGFLFVFFASILIVLTLTFNGIDILNDTLGFVLVIIGALYFIINKEVIGKKDQSLIWIFSFFVIISLINHIATVFYKSEITNQIFVWINAFSGPVILLSLSLIGYNLSKNHIPVLQKKWKNLSIISGALFVFFVAVQITSFLINKNINVEISNLKSDGLSSVIISIVVIVLVVKYFSVFWKTYSETKKLN
jgi:hypothetical protein